MKIHSLLALSLVAISSAPLFAGSDNDAKIVDAAKASYNFHTVLQGSVDVKSSDGNVTLSGTVPDRDDKAIAEDTVKNLPGVVSVDNEIVVTSPAPEHSDAWIALEIRAKLLVKANVSATSTKVEVHDGDVTLSGTADNLAQKELTEVYVKQVENVKSVTNDIEVKEPVAGTQTVGEKIDDASITTQVKFALLAHRPTSAAHTKVMTMDGVVTLSGEADSDAEKSLAGQLAQGIRGVQSVTNDMTVKSGDMTAKS